jgi:hypothetical protein
MLASYVEETANNPGTATTINLGGAATGRRDFVSSFGSGATILYTLDGGSQAEWGFGTVTAGTPNTLSRSTVIGNTAGTTARLNFTGATRVFCTLPAQAALFRNPATGAIMCGATELGPLAGFRNLVINGNPTINQRGYASGTPTVGAIQYTLDRWFVVTAGQSLAWTDSAGVRTVTAPAGGVGQVIEGASILGGTYTLSWTGTASATVNGAAVANGGTVTLTGGALAELRFAGGTFALAQLERGGVATAFEMRPRQVELALCQRYFENILFAVSGYVNAGGLDIYNVVNWRVEKRAAPSIVKAGTSLANCTDPGAPSPSLTAYYAFLRSSAAGVMTGTYVVGASAEY